MASAKQYKKLGAFGGGSRKAAPKTSNEIYQFKIILRRIHPKIWRRIQVPGSYNFHDLHIAIQKAMGWNSIVGDYHAHEFTVLNPETKTRETIGQIDSDSVDSICFSGLRSLMNMQDEETLDEYRRYICNYFKEPTVDRALYRYDFGDNWVHVLRLEKISEPEPDVKYPRCLDGQRACPPEDCGGVSGYADLLHILATPTHSEYHERIEWLENVSPGFKPDEFDPTVPFNSLCNFVVQFRVTLLESSPKIWRTIQVPDTFTMYDLHEAIKKAMGYKQDAQNPKFTLKNILMPFEQVIKLKPNRSSPLITETFLYLNQSSLHHYRQGWIHDVVMNASFKPVAGMKYPRCSDGYGACPLEDFGNVAAYNEFVKILKNSTHPEHAAKTEWLKANHPDFDHAKFNMEELFSKEN